MPCFSNNTRHNVEQLDKMCYVQISKNPVAAYAFTDDKYSRRVIFEFLNKVLDIFFNKVGDKWQFYTEDLNLGIK
jgi:hypothetical protein